VEKIKGYALLLSMLVLACSSKNDSTVVAQFDKEKLYASDVLIPEHLTASDSIDYLKIQAQQWIRTQVFYAYAKSYLSDSTKVQIKKQLDNIKKQLYIAAYQQLLLEQTPTFQISSDEIQQFYENNKNSFLLQSHLVQINFVKLSQKDPAVPLIRKQFQSNSPNLQEIRKLAQNAQSSFLLPNTWTYFNEVLKEIPFSFNNTNEFLKNNSYFEIRDGESIILGKIYKYLLPGDIAPLFIVEDQIKSLLNQEKKDQYLEEQYNKMLQKALLEHNIKIFVHEN